MHKNLNAYHRINGAANHGGIHVKLAKEPECVDHSRFSPAKLIPFSGSSFDWAKTNAGQDVEKYLEISCTLSAN
jgi:hypothetical protein